jgi:enterochelin esterase-like enzyme
LEHRYGDGLVEIRRHELAAKHAAIFVAPSFSQLPWYADHPTDCAIRQESHFLQVVLPYVEKTYPVESEPRGRLLLGFSKSAWGAWSVLLRHPDVFGRAAGWDGPLMMERHGKYGSSAIFGTQENFETYRLARLVRERASDLRDRPRLILCGYSGFRPDCQQMHALLDELRIAHIYRDGPERAHDWHSSWVSDAVALLLQP